MKLGLGVAITSTRTLGGSITQSAPSVLNTYANSTSVYANANGFKAPMLNIEQQITARGG